MRDPLFPDHSGVLIQLVKLFKLVTSKFDSNDFDKQVLGGKLQQIKKSLQI